MNEFRVGAKRILRRLFGGSFVWKLLQRARHRTGGQLMPIQVERVSPALAAGWKASSIPDKQRMLTVRELAEMYAGNMPRPYEVLVDAIRPIHKSGSSIVEVGCSTAYHYEVLRHAFGEDVRYFGSDYSQAMIEKAREIYATLPVLVADATALPHGDASCDILVSGGCLLHIPDYERAIAESARVSRRWVVFHRTPIARGPTTHFTKKAYGVQCVEIHFNEMDLHGICEAHGLELARTCVIAETADTVDKTYVYRKAPRAAPGRPN